MAITGFNKCRTVSAFGQPPKRTKPKEIQTKAVGVIFLYCFLRLSARVFAAGFVAICCKRENLQIRRPEGFAPLP
jgi:hypothetical protein